MMKVLFQHAIRLLPAENSIDSKATVADDIVSNLLPHGVGLFEKLVL